MIYFSVFFVNAELDYLHIISTVISVCYLSHNEVLCEDVPRWMSRFLVPKISKTIFVSDLQIALLNSLAGVLRTLKEPRNSYQ